MITLLPKQSYERLGIRPHPLFWWVLFGEGFSNPNGYEDLVGETYAPKHALSIDNVIYFAGKEMEETGEKALAYWSDVVRFPKIRSIIEKLERELLEKARESNIAALRKAHMAYAPAINVVFQLDKALEAKLRSELSKYVSGDEFEALMSDLNIPLKDNIYLKEELELVQTDDLESHVESYKWMRSRYGVLDEYTVAEAKERLESLDKEELLARHAQNRKRAEAAVAKAKNLLGEDCAVLVDIMQFIIYYRTVRTDMLHLAYYLFAPALQYIADERGMSYQDILHCTYQEIQGDLPTSEIIKARQKAFALVVHNGDLSKVYIGDDVDWIQSYLKDDLEGVTEFKGQAAYKGQVSGPVRIVHSKEDFASFNEGDVLVSSMTTPDMVPLMKLASAVVTDEGGITCHAAIIARELHIPTIIGTKVATRVLGNGDSIEVDAKNGIVKKL